MHEQTQATPVLDYARARRRFRLHLPTALLCLVVVLGLNVWPHFVTTGVPRAPWMPEPQLGWPWIFFWGEKRLGTYSVSWTTENFLYDLAWAASLVLVPPYMMWCIIQRRWTTVVNILLLLLLAAVVIAIKLNIRV